MAGRDMRRDLFAMAGILVTVLGLVGMAGRPPLVGSPAPEVALKDVGGREVRLSDQRGRVVLVNFWATWCKPCEAEMPAMQTSFHKLGPSGFVILAINTLDRPADAAEHSRTRGYTFPILFDHREETANRFRVNRLPTSFLIDREGIIREQIMGSLLTEERITELVRAYGGSSSLPKRP